MRAPILRFAEFTDDWEATTLENLAEVERGKFSVRPRNDPRYFGGEMPFVQTGDVTGSDMYLKGYSQTLNADGIKVSKVFPADTILITIAANIGDTTITQYAVACPDSVVAIQAKKDLANTIFLKNLIDLQKENLDSQATQNAQKNINLQVLKPLQLIAPSKAEQTKITTFLSAVDEKISQLSQKLHLLGQYKQGMMQKLFSQQIRFKADDGSDFEEWKENKFGECINVFDNLRKPISASERIAGNTPYYGANGIQSYIDGYTHDGEFILIAEDGANDLINYPIQYVNGKIWVNNHAHVVSGHHEKIQNKFLKYRLKSIDFTKYLVGGGRAKLNAGAMKEISFSAPCLEEQTKIADFLSSIDQKIDVVSEQLEQEKKKKKGLLQQMFV